MTALTAAREFLDSGRIYSRGEMEAIVRPLVVIADNAEMFERRIKQMIGSNADDWRYYLNACNAALRAKRG